MYKRILCPTDFSEASLRALDIAVKLAVTGEAELCLLYVEPDIRAALASGELSSYDAALNRAKAIRNLSDVIQEHTPREQRWSTLLRQGDAGTEIIRAANEQQVDLIVLSAHGGGSPDEPFGANAHRVMREGTCPVLVLTTPCSEADTTVRDIGEQTVVLPANYETAHTGSHALYLDGD